MTGERGGGDAGMNTCYVMRVCATAGSTLPGYRMSKHYVESETPIFAAVPCLPYVSFRAVDRMSATVVVVVTRHGSASHPPTHRTNHCIHSSAPLFFSFFFYTVPSEGGVGHSATGLSGADVTCRCLWLQPLRTDTEPHRAIIHSRDVAARAISSSQVKPEAGGRHGSGSCTEWASKVKVGRRVDKVL